MFVAVNHILYGLLCSWAWCCFYGKNRKQARIVCWIAVFAYTTKVRSYCLLWPFELLVCLEEILNSCVFLFFCKMG